MTKRLTVRCPYRCGGVDYSPIQPYLDKGYKEVGARYDPEDMSVIVRLEKEETT